MSSPCDGLFEAPNVALGTIFGVRAFNVLDNGRLGPANTHGYIWKPGENAAECVRYDTTRHRHRPAERLCGCGFYAYYAGDNDYYHGEAAGMVAGVIEAWGKTQVGTRGFRAEKAKIVALVVPYPPKESHNHWYCRVARWMAKDANREANFGIGGGISAIVGMITAVLGGVFGLWYLLWPGIVVMWVGITSFCIASHSLSSHRYDRMKDKIANLPNLYPEARIFKTEEAMRKAFPLERPKRDGWHQGPPKRKYNLGKNKFEWEDYQ